MYKRVVFGRSTNLNLWLFLALALPFSLVFCGRGVATCKTCAQLLFERRFVAILWRGPTCPSPGLVLLEIQIARRRSHDHDGAASASDCFCTVLFSALHQQISTSVCWLVDLLPVPLSAMTTKQKQGTHTVKPSWRGWDSKKKENGHVPEREV